MGVGAKIKQTLEERKMSQRKLARLADLSSSGLCSIINEAVSPKEDTLKRIAKVLGVSVAYLVGEEDAPPPPSEIDNAIAGLADGLSPEEVQRVLDFIAGIKAARKE